MHVQDYCDKKKIFWPKHTKAQENANDMQGKEVNTIKVTKGSSTYGENSNDLHLVALEDIKNMSMMLTNWSTKIRHGDAKKMRVRLELVQQKNGKAKNNS